MVPVKARRMVEKGCVAYLAHIRDPSAEVPSMDSVPVVREFPDEFPADLLGMPPDRDIDFYGSDGQPLVPPIRVARGRGRGRGRGVARSAVGAAPIKPLVAPSQEHAPDIVEPTGPTQAPAMPIVILGLQEALAQILTVCTGLAKVVSAQAAPTTSQEGGVWLVPTEREKIRRFINGLNQPFYFVMTLGNVAGAKFDEIVDCARRLEIVCTQEHEEREAKRSCGPDTPTINSVPVVREFLDVFPADLLVALLGHTVSSERIKVDLKNIDAVQSWPRPSSATEIQNFLSLAGYYRHFVVGFPSIASPLTKLTQKSASFRWSDECEESFQKLKTSLNKTPRRWLELLKDYDITILYHPGKANVVADALSRKTVSMRILAFVPIGKRPLAVDVHDLANQFVSFLKDIVQHGDAKDITIGDDGMLRIQGWVCVPNVDGLRELILEEAHSSRYSFHLGASKMYQDLRQHYWWRRMNKDIVGFVARCLNCQQRIGEVAYELALPPSLSGIHLVFHVSMLRKYVGDPSHVLDFSIVQLDGNLIYDVEVVAILDRQVRKLRSKNIASVKV
ncbi:uncharacterized protein [Nicotiana tomentosiformis]|uniref:uncharacterized protein n=1 Tax=Nicotiana tomentosiformis TaxID=4098 RepID=UPI00388C553B